MEAKSFTLTREVLEESKKLEALVEGLQIKTEMKLMRVDELEQIKKILTENHQEQMDANTDFEFEALVPNRRTSAGRANSLSTVRIVKPLAMKKNFSGNM